MTDFIRHRDGFVSFEIETEPTAHTFECSNTPGYFRCPACEAVAHFERDEKRYCIHPADQDEPSFLVESWEDPRTITAHTGYERSR